MPAKLGSDLRSQGRKNACVLFKFSDEEKRRLWDANKHHVFKKPSMRSGDCHLWSGSLQNGYPSVSQGHAASKIKVHILAAWVTTQELPGESHVASHLCHRKKCINPKHLVIESITKNNQRKGCLCQLIDSAGKRWNLCPHEPKCINPDEENIGTFQPTLDEEIQAVVTLDE
jgi:hypothetical protein